MEAKTYKISGLTLVPVTVTAGQQKLINRLVREAMQSSSIDVQGNDNPLLVYAVLWQALLEIDGVTRMLSLILTKKGTEWSESAASELQVVLDGLPFENVTDLYNGAMTSFFVDHPRSASGIMLFLMGYLKNSEQLIKRLQMPDGVEQRARTTSTP